MREETQAWTAEFQTVLKEIDQSALKARKPVALAAIDVLVTNGDQTTSGWSLSIDGGTEVRHSGNQGSAANLLPGIHRVSVSGEIGGTLKRAEQGVEVKEGTAQTVTLTLA